MAKEPEGRKLLDQLGFPKNVRFAIENPEAVHFLIISTGQEWNPRQDLFDAIAAFANLSGNAINIGITSQEPIIDNNGNILAYDVVVNPKTPPQSTQPPTKLM